MGNLFVGQVVGDTARTLSERFGKIVQQRESVSRSNDNVTTSTNTQLDNLIPASKIANLSQGMFVGAVADNIDQPIEQKIFHARIDLDTRRITAETAAYVPIPELASFVDENGTDRMDEVVKANYIRIKTDVEEIIRREIERIVKDPDLKYLLKK